MEPLWADLLNSDWHDHLGSGRTEDRLGNDVWLAAFLGRCGWKGARLPGQAERDGLRALRALLRRMVDALVRGRPPAARDVAAINGVLATRRVCHQLARRNGRWNLRAEAESADTGAVMAAVADAFAAMLVDGEPGRVKICANPDCRWVIYDESRNRTRQWCDAKECGNLIKVRRFRERRRSAAPI